MVILTVRVLCVWVFTVWPARSCPLAVTKMINLLANLNTKRYNKDIPLYRESCYIIVTLWNF